MSSTTLLERSPAGAAESARDLAPAIVASSTVLPEHRYRQDDLFQTFDAIMPNSTLKDGLAERLFDHVGVVERYLALPKERYAALRGFQDRNDAWIEVAIQLGNRAVLAALDEAELDASEVGMLMTTTVTGVAVPSLDARLMNRIAFPPDLVRMPLFGLGCLGGAAGVARVADWLRAYPDRCAMLLSVELCSLTFQADDWSVANAVSCGLFGDGAAAVILAGAEHPLAARRGRAASPRVVASRSTFFPETERVMGWDIGDNGFKVVLSTDVPRIVRDHAPGAVDGLLAEHGLTRADVGAWVMHPGGPKVIDAMEDGLGLGRGALAATRESLARIGNLSSASVLFLLDEQRRRRRSPGGGHYGILMAMGPAFCAETVLLRFEGEQP